MAMAIKKIEGEEAVHYVPPRKKRGKGESVKMQPPMTPMVDVTFQLLLFFLITFQFRLAEGEIPGSLPQQGTGGVSTVKDIEMPIRINLRPSGADGVIFEMEGVSTTISNAGELYEKLLGRKTAVGATVDGPCELPIVIKSRGDVQWRWVAEAFNQSVRAKYKNIGFAASS